MEKSWLDMLPYPLSKRPQGWSGPCYATHLDKLRYAFDDWDRRESRAPGREHVRAIAQHKDLQGAIVVAPEFRDLQRFIGLQGGGRCHIDLNHEVRGWVHRQINLVFSHHLSLMLNVEAIIRLNACRHLLASKRRGPQGFPRYVQLVQEDLEEIANDHLSLFMFGQRRHNFQCSLAIRYTGTPMFSQLLDDGLKLVPAYLALARRPVLVEREFVVGTG